MLRVAHHYELTNTGLQRRANEDNMFARPPLFAVADGMGGAQAGEVASQIAVEAFEDALPEDGGSAEHALADRAREANARIHGLSQSDRRRAGMGTTLTAAYVGPDAVSIAHVGDSRAYRLRDGTLERLTRDHSLVGELVRRGKLTEEQADEHPQRSIITRALGPEPDVEVDTRTYPAQDGDLFLLCSDGLTSMIHEPQIAEILVATPDLGKAGSRLIAAANENGGKDNITVVLFEVERVAGVVGDGTDQPTTVSQAVGGASGATHEPPTADHETVPAMPAVASEPAPEDEHSTLPHRAITPEAAAAARARARDAAAEPQTAAREGSGVAARRPRRRPAPAPGTRRSRRWVAPVVIGLVIVFAVIAGAWYATRAVYFVGTNDDGIVTIYNGIPYEGPFGIALYDTHYTSGISAEQVPPAQREQLLDHELRSQEDAADLVRELELDRLDQADGGQ